MRVHLSKTLCAAAVLAAGLSVPVAAAPTPYFTASGVGSMGGPESDWGNFTQASVAFEVFIDFTSTVDNEVNAINLWEAGGTGKGSGLALAGDDLHFFSGGSNTHVVSGSHGLTAGETNVQIVSVVEFGAGTGDNELLTIYVNGTQIGQADLENTNDWAGNDTAGLGAGFNTQRWAGTALFDSSQVQNYPETNISFAVYRLASSGGPVDNTVANILVPEPSSLALLGLGALLVARRRRG